MLPRTAILVFGNTASREAAAKQLVAGGGLHRNQEVAARLIRRTLQTVHQSGLPVLTCFDPDQVGETFAERLANAFEAAFAQGYEQVITVGTDSPALSVQHLKTAQQALQSQDAVFGPALDGGVYLIGLRRAGFRKEAFLQLGWLSADLQSTLRSDQPEAIWLAPLQDIDTAEDLHTFLLSHRGAWASALAVLVWLPVVASETFEASTHYITQIGQVHAHRGPPAVLTA